MVQDILRGAARLPKFYSPSNLTNRHSSQSLEIEGRNVRLEGEESITLLIYALEMLENEIDLIEHVANHIITPCCQLLVNSETG